MAGFDISTPHSYTITSLVKVTYFLKSAFVCKDATKWDSYLIGNKRFFGNYEPVNSRTVPYSIFSFALSVSLTPRLVDKFDRYV